MVSNNICTFMYKNNKSSNFFPFNVFSYYFFKHSRVREQVITSTILAKYYSKLSLLLKLIKYLTFGQITSLRRKEKKSITLQNLQGISTYV